MIPINHAREDKYTKKNHNSVIRPIKKGSWLKTDNTGKDKFSKIKKGGKIY